MNKFDVIISWTILHKSVIEYFYTNQLLNKSFPCDQNVDKPNAAIERILSNFYVAELIGLETNWN